MPSSSGAYCLPRRPPAGQKGFDVLIVVVIVLAVGLHADRRSDDFALFQRGAILRGDDADVVDLIVGRAADDDRIEAVDLAQALLPFGQRPIAIDRVDAVLGDHVEHGQVDGIDAFAEDGPLAAFLAAFEKCQHVLKMVALDHPAQGLAGAQGFARSGEDVADLALLDRDQRPFVDGVLPAPQAEVQSAAEHVAVESRLRRCKATIAPSPSEPSADHSFSTMPTLSFGM